jgi:hypothetical protein
MADYNLTGVEPLSFRCTTTVAQYAAVMMDGTTEGNIVVTTGITSPCIGFAMQSGVAGDIIPVQMAGIAKAIASTTIAINAEVMCDASGKITTASGATANSVGICLSTGGTGGADIVSLLVMLSRKGAANT